MSVHTRIVFFKFFEYANFSDKLLCLYDTRPTHMLTQTHPSLEITKLGMCGVSDNTEKTDTFDTDKAFSVHR